jgi:hypothetical protein
MVRPIRIVLCDPPTAFAWLDRWRRQDRWILEAREGAVHEYLVDEAAIAGRVRELAATIERALPQALEDPHDPTMRHR